MYSRIGEWIVWKIDQKDSIKSNTLHNRNLFNAMISRINGSYCRIYVLTNHLTNTLISDQKL